jgi:hypothetical protein
LDLFHRIECVQNLPERSRQEQRISSG